MRYSIPPPSINVHTSSFKFLMLSKMEAAIDDEEELLNLSLAIVADHSGAAERMRKRKTRVDTNLRSSSPLNNSLLSYDHQGCDEGMKIFRLLQMREQMLKLDHKKKGATVDHHQNIHGNKGLHLIHMLLITATAVNESNVGSALENLSELYKSVSLCGDSVQRVVAYFADGLVARLLTRKSPFYDKIMKDPTNEEEFVAFTELYRVSPYYQFAHFTANQAIIEQFEKEEEKNNRALHVIDFDVSYGFQWPSLIQSLSEKATSGNRISLRITGFGTSLDELCDTENRLVSFSKGFRNLAFEFQGLLRGSFKVFNLRKKRNETIAVNLVFHLNSLNNNLKISDLLKSVHLLNPSIVILVEQEDSRSPRSFLSRFMESLHYFAAMFDSLDDCLPLESSERLSIEKNHLGKEIKSMLNFEDDEDNHDDRLNCPKIERIMTDTWKARMESHGFEGISLSSKSKIQARLLLKIRTHYCPVLHCDAAAGFKVFERDDGKTISLGWQDRYLLTVSAWHCV